MEKIIMEPSATRNAFSPSPRPSQPSKTEARRRYHQAMSVPWPIPKDIRTMTDHCRAAPSQGRAQCKGGWNCCDFWQDKINPYDSHPSKIDMANHQHPSMGCGGFNASGPPPPPPRQANGHVPATADKYYNHPTTDIRRLQQTMYTPVILTNPAGETRVTFPMTQDTLGQPDMTSANCIPMVPSQPGYQNLTQGIYPGPCPQLDGYARSMCGGGQCPNSSYKHPDTFNGMLFPQGSRSTDPSWPCPPQTMMPPRNLHGNPFDGFQDTFPPTPQDQGRVGYDLPFRPPNLQIPHYDGSYDECYNARGSRGKRMAKEYVPENLDQRYRRLTSMYGSYGSYLLARPRPKRYISEEGAHGHGHKQLRLGASPNYQKCNC